MKRIAVLLGLMISMGFTGFAQTSTGAKETGWAEMKNFHSIMSVTFHAAEEGNLTPLKTRIAELYRASKVWYASEIPSSYKAEETRATLEKLMLQCHEVWRNVDDKSDDAKLTALITEAHNTFHKIVGECKK
ncbi:MAG: hypothetical protein ACKO5C_01520 [Ferruginibacter sp.]